jgi:hypothetical protein
MNLPDAKYHEVSKNADHECHDQPDLNGPDPMIAA